MLTFGPRRLRPLPARTLLLMLAQAMNLTAAVLAVSVAALAGAALAPTPALATLPYGAQFASVMVLTYPAAMAMRRWGRRAVFVMGAWALLLAGVTGFIAQEHGHFLLLLTSHVLLGAYIAGANFYRFAALDHLPEAQHARALSLVVAGGVLAAVLGPLLASTLRGLAGFAEFSLCYAALCLLAVLTLLVLAAWRPPHAAAPQAATVAAAAPTPAVVAAAAAPTPTPTHAGGPDKQVLLAVTGAAAAYFLMNLQMIQSSLVMPDICSAAASTLAIQAHVLAMFAPSFFTGTLITRIGLRATLCNGFALLAGACILGTLPAAYAHVLPALILLGLGWNFVYVASGALLAQRVAAASRHRWQGINDTVIAACATLGAVLPAPLLTSLGWQMSNALLAPACLLGVVVIWRMLSSNGEAREPAVPNAVLKPPAPH